MRLYANEMASTTHDHLANGYLLGLLQGFADDGVTLIGIVTVRREIVGLLPIAAIDLGGVHEAHHVDSVLCLQLQIVNLFGPEENVLSLAMLVAPNDFVLWDFLEAGLGRNAFHVADGLTRWLMDHAKRNRILRRDSGVELYGDKDKTQAKVA